MDMTESAPVTWTGSILLPSVERLAIFDPKHLGDVGAVYVKIQKPDFIAVAGECICKVHGYSRFSHPAFSRKNQDNVFYVNVCLGGEAGFCIGAGSRCRTAGTFVGAGIFFGFGR